MESGARKAERRLALELWLPRGVKDTGRHQTQEKWAGNPGHIEDDKNAINLSQGPPALSSDLPFGCVAVYRFWAKDTGPSICLY